MMKQGFLKELDHELSALSKQERDDILNDYEEHFTAGYEAGKSDEEIIASLGRPKDISQEILETSDVEVLIKEKEVVVLGDSHVKVVTQRNIGALICLLIFHGLIGFWIFFAVAMTIMSIFFAGLVMLASPLLYVIAMPWQGFYLQDFFIGLAFSGCGYFIALGMWRLGKVVGRVVVNHVKYLASLATGGTK